VGQNRLVSHFSKGILLVIISLSSFETCKSSNLPIVDGNGTYSLPFLESSDCADLNPNFRLSSVMSIVYENCSFERTRFGVVEA
jgi:hypothetical protein